MRRVPLFPVVVARALGVVPAVSRARQRRAALQGVAATVLLGGFGFLGVAGAGSAAASPATTTSCGSATCTVTFIPTGGLQDFTVPAGVSSVAITVDGGSTPPFFNSDTISGGVSSGTLAARPGTTYEVLVGASGSAGQTDLTNATGGGPVSGGGGAGGNAVASDAFYDFAAGSGGGGSFVFTSTGVPLLVAGGAGGNAAQGCTGGFGGGVDASAGAGGAAEALFNEGCQLGGGPAGRPRQERPARAAPAAQPAQPGQVPRAPARRAAAAPVAREALPRVGERPAVVVVVVATTAAAPAVAAWPVPSAHSAAGEVAARGMPPRGSPPSAAAPVSTVATGS